MKYLFLLFLFIPLSSFSLNESLVYMPPNPEYMQFIVPKYLSWHTGHFAFPKPSPLLTTLTQHLDRWQLPGSQHREIQFKYAAKDDKAVFSLRVFVHPDLRGKKELTGPGLPEGKAVWFAEWHDKGKFCLVHNEGPEHFSVWCRDPGKNRYELSHEEKTTTEIPDGWPVPFPWERPEMIAVQVKGKTQEMIFSRAMTHPNMTPRALLPIVNLHTKETHIPLDRVSVTTEGEIRVFYP